MSRSNSNNIVQVQVAPAPIVITNKPNESNSNNNTDVESISAPTSTTSASPVPVATQVSVLSPVRIMPLTSFIDNSLASNVNNLASSQSFTERELLLLEGYKTSRIVRVVTFIEILFVIFFGVLIPPFFCVLPFPIAGYIGARRWSHCLLYVFTVYTVLEIIVGIVTLFYFYQNILYLVFRLIDIAFNIYVLRKASTLTAFIRALDPTDIYFLMNNQAIKQVEKGVLI